MFLTTSIIKMASQDWDMRKSLTFWPYKGVTDWVLDVFEKMHVRSPDCYTLI